MPHTHGCRLLIPAPTRENALLFELHKLNVPCSKGGIRLSPTSTELCGKLEQIPLLHRKVYFHSYTFNPQIELHGRPAFAVFFRLVDYCHEVVLTSRNGSFEVGPTDRIWCSYTVHLPYGNRVAIRLQMGAGLNHRSSSFTSVMREENGEGICKGMALTLEDGESLWKHCSKPGDPLRNVQIVSEENMIRLNISVSGKRGNGAGMWLKLWWMEKPVENIVGKCEYGWIASGEFCISSFRDARRSWLQAENECKRRKGHLASILSDRQQHNLDQLLLHT